MKTNYLSFLSLSLFLAVLGCDGQKRSLRDCNYNGTEVFGITVDGRFRGAFAEYIPAEGPGGLAIFRRGLVPGASDLQNSPTDPRDVKVLGLEKGRVTHGIADLVEAQFVNLYGLAAKDDEGCVVVDELVLEVKRTQGFSGELAVPRPDDSYIIDIDIID